ncbi:hypothetical protein J2810_001812 [Chryseobacterium rhizosphaerae]|uniref:hypothetical protein n=1 Tax=Chryseobacterium rhizosphaerae TaxID=395937 RepID=UPI0028609819|nr:hypothetical protein [Chryseobacterium rhizosphaerae]MDR6545764.1 hypothetical protein [Chryseobacterium rhizosphaerae]
MMIIRVFGIALILIGGFLAYGVAGSFSRMLHGEKIIATIVDIEKVTDKYKKFDKPSYSYYPILKFIYKNRTMQLTDKSHNSTEKEVKTKIKIYYSEKYGISRGFSAIEIVFSIISLAFIFFGIIALFKSK